MSNITRAKNSLKQKLSLNDYIAPVSRHTSKPAPQPARKLVLQKQKVQPTKQLDLHASQKQSRTGTPASQYACEDKIKATYYLSKDDNQALLDIFIKRLQENKKTDKSALISEAIRLLYKKEMKL